MAMGKSPSRVIDGPYAQWGTGDDICTISLANGSNVKLGQPMCIDMTQLGPDQNVPNNGALLPQCERVVAASSTGAGALFGVITSIGTNAPAGLKQTSVNGITTWTNSSGSTMVVPLVVRQLGWAYVYAGTVTGGRAVKIGDPLTVTSSNAFAIVGSAAIGSTQPMGQLVGYALGTAINTTQGGIPAASGSVPTVGLGAPASAGIISIVPLSLAGIVIGTQLLIDSLASGVQESVSVGSISYPTFSVALANAHAANFRITGPNTNALISTNLISVANQQTTAALVACYVNTTS